MSSRADKVCTCTRARVRTDDHRRATLLHLQVVDFKDFGERPARGLDTALYIGSKLTAKSQGMLRSMGVKYILNCTPTRK
jgi:hypothetical protein